jgi:hypothetical protein
MNDIDAQVNKVAGTKLTFLTKGRAAAATMLAAGALVAGALGTTPADANADLFVALAYSWRSELAGFANNQPDSESARFAALMKCQDGGGNHCIWFGSFRNECAALAVAEGERSSTAAAPDVRTAEQKALQQLPGGLIAVSGCADNRPATQPAPPRKVPFPLPPLAPAEQ